jgi:hypothetical protein
VGLSNQEGDAISARTRQRASTVPNDARRGQHRRREISTGKALKYLILPVETVDSRAWLLLYAHAAPCTHGGMAMGIQLRWNLQAGSHDYPAGSGVCATELAVLVAGFEYRPVVDPKDAPDCFSRTIVSPTMILNDAMPHNLRQKLLTPFVTRLAYTADTSEVEAQRARFMAVEFVRRIIGRFREKQFKNRSDLADLCRCVRKSKNETIRDAGIRADLSMHFGGTPCEIAARVGNNVTACASVGSEAVVYTIACKILSDAILMGKHRVLNMADANRHLEKVKQAADQRMERQLELFCRARICATEGHRKAELCPV